MQGHNTRVPVSKAAATSAKAWSFLNDSNPSLSEHRWELPAKFNYQRVEDAPEAKSLSSVCCRDESELWVQEANDSNGSLAPQAAPGAAPAPASTSHPQQRRHWSVSAAARAHLEELAVPTSSPC